MRNWAAWPPPSHQWSLTLKILIGMKLFEMGLVLYLAMGSVCFWMWVCLCVCQRRDVCCLLSCYAGEVCEKRGYGPITLRAGNSERGWEILKKPSHFPAEAAATKQLSCNPCLCCLCMFCVNTAEEDSLGSYELFTYVFGTRFYPKPLRVHSIGLWSCDLQARNT